METIPRLELCGAVLLSRLMTNVCDSTRMDFSILRCWTDSTTVIDWLKTSSRLDVFVANRVRKIQPSFPHHFWHHVPGVDNPADLPSRGIPAATLLKSSLWLHGPSWLASTEFPDDPRSLTCSAKKSSILTFIHRCSSFVFMTRVIGHMSRLAHYILNPNLVRGKPLSADEISTALFRIVRAVQDEVFQDELRKCNRHELPKSNIKFLSPFVDEEGILRVGGRLERSALPYGLKHPILLPAKHHFTEVVVRHFHIQLLHAPPQMLLSAIREQFWITRGPDVVRHAVHGCIVCHRQTAKSVTQIMGQLPPSRTTPARPFSQCGVDYAGPFSLNLRTGRNPPSCKGYVSLFVRMATTAIHLELVGDLSTPAFIAALTRFLSRRGLPSNVYYDGGTNFVGARNEMEEIQKFLASSAHITSVSNFLAAKGISLNVNPPLAPHHGGLWEAGVKSMKFHLRRIMAERRLSTEEFSTLLCQTEACLNSRPLSAMTTDPADYEVLTPGHFLIGD